MKSALHFANSASSSRETPPAAPPPFDALLAWNTEVLAASDRCLTRVLDHMTAAQRATGWPDRVSTSARDCILEASKLQTRMLDETIVQTVAKTLETWDQLLATTGGAPAEGGRRRKSRTPEIARWPLHDAERHVLQFGEMSVAPFRAWMQAADMWQRRWMAAMSGGWTAPRSIAGGKKGGRAKP